MPKRIFILSQRLCRLALPNLPIRLFKDCKAVKRFLRYSVIFTIVQIHTLIIGQLLFSYAMLHGISFIQRMVIVIKENQGFLCRHG